MPAAKKRVVVVTVAASAGALALAGVFTPGPPAAVDGSVGGILAATPDPKTSCVTVAMARGTHRYDHGAGSAEPYFLDRGPLRFRCWVPARPGQALVVGEAGAFGCADMRRILGIAPLVGYDLTFDAGLCVVAPGAGAIYTTRHE